MSDEHLFGERPLKKIALQHVEAAMADALSELAGEPYTASVIRFDLEPSTNAALLDTYEFTLRVTRQTSGPSLDAKRDASDIPLTQTKRDADIADSGQIERTPADRTLTGLTGRQLNQEWDVGARHALYHHEGRWYHQLHRFPGALFDYNGYVLFNSAEDFTNCTHLAITQDVHVPRGINAIPGYVRRR